MTDHQQNKFEEEKLQKCLADIIQANSNSSIKLKKIEQGLQILQKLLNNMITNKLDQKYRKLNTQNKMIQAKLIPIMTTEQMSELLSALNYVKSSDDETVYIHDSRCNSKEGFLQVINVEIENIQSQIKKLQEQTLAKSPQTSSRGAQRKQDNQAEIHRIQEKIKREKDLKVLENKSLEKQNSLFDQKPVASILAQVNQEIFVQQTSLVGSTSAGNLDEELEENKKEQGILDPIDIVQTQENLVSDGLEERNTYGQDDGTVPQTPNLQELTSKRKNRIRRDNDQNGGGCCFGPSGQRQQGNRQGCSIF